MPSKVLEYTIAGVLRRYLGLRDPELCLYFEEVPDVAAYDQHVWIRQMQEPNSPGIYVRFHVNNEGLAPTPAEYLQVVREAAFDNLYDAETVQVKTLRAYIDGDLEVARAVESVLPAYTSSMDELENFGHKFLERKSQHVRAVAMW